MQYNDTYSVYKAGTKCFDCSESYISIPEVTEIPIDCKEIDIDSAIAVNESNQSIEFCRGIFREACLKNKQFATHFSLYVSKMRSEDEKVKERHLGLPIFDMTNKVDKDKMYLCDDLENILSTVISYWDCGKAAFVVEKYKSSKTNFPLSSNNFPIITGI